jgi:hypothetical protein
MDFIADDSERVDIHIHISEGLSQFPPCGVEIIHLSLQCGDMGFQFLSPTPCLIPERVFLFFGHAKYLPVDVFIAVPLSAFHNHHETKKFNRSTGNPAERCPIASLGSGFCFSSNYYLAGSAQSP